MIDKPKKKKNYRHRFKKKNSILVKIISIFLYDYLVLSILLGKINQAIPAHYIWILELAYNITPNIGM